MRELKFRAWDKQNKSMEEVELLGDAVLRIKHAEWEDREDFEVMQYTGLKDKNGVEIYEGDIVRIDETEDIDVVDWTDGKEYGIGFGLFSCFKYEVIGNIHENLELLKEGE